MGTGIQLNTVGVGNPTGLLMERGLGLRECVTITVGTVVGVGLFTVGTSAIGWLGPTILVATFCAFLFSLYPSLLYAEMGAALPFAGGTYNFAVEGLGKPWGMLAGWNFVISLIAVASGEALAFSNYFKWLLEGLGVTLTVDERIIAGLLILIFTLINWRGIKLAGRWQNAFVFFFWGAALVWFIMMFPRIDLGNYIPFVPLEGTGWREFILATSLVWWCFAGFETAVAMGEEIRYPQINIPRAMFLTPFIVFIVTAVFQWFLLGIVPGSELAMLKDAAAPYAEGMKAAGIMGIPFVLLCFGISFGGDLSTINPSVASPARYLFSMSRDGVLPPIFARLHPTYRTPHVAVWLLGILMLLLVATGSIIYVATISLFADLLYYIIGFMAAVGLRFKRADLARPYRAPLLVPGAIVSILAYIVMVTQLPKDGVVTGIAWSIVGLFFYFVWVQTRAGKQALEKGETENARAACRFPELPSKEIRATMDKEYRLWRNIVGALFVASILQFLVPYLI